MEKSADAFRTISEVAEWLGVPTHVLRFWESRFPQVKPVKRAGGRRYYRPADMSLLAGIRVLLHDQGMTIRGAQKLLREQGIKHVAALCDRDLGAEPVQIDVPETAPAQPSTPDNTVVELPASAFAASEKPAPTETPITKSDNAAALGGGDAPMPLFSSGRPAAPRAKQAAAPPDAPPAPMPEAPPPPRPRFELPGPSPEAPAALRTLVRDLATRPDALSAMSPEQAKDVCQKLEDLRARLAGSDPA